MPTQYDAWRQAWKLVDPEVRDGVLSSRGAPAKAARQTVFAQIFPDLEASLRSPRKSGSQIGQTEADLIKTAVLTQAARLRTVSRLAGFIQEWLTPARTPEVQPQLARTRNRADEYFKLTQRLIRRGGIDGLASLTDTNIEAWLREYYGLDGPGKPESSAGPREVYHHLHSPGVAEHVRSDLAHAFDTIPRNTHADGSKLAPLGLVPGDRPVGEARSALESAARTVLDGVAHDTLCRQLGLTAVLEGPLEAPPVLTTDSGRAAERSRPLDRPLENRLLDNNDERTGTVTRGMTVGELIAEEVSRTASPLGLSEEANRLALIAAVATMQVITWPEGKTPKILAGDDLAAAADKVSWRVHSHFPGKTFEMLRATTRASINDPTSTFSPRLWSRLHNWERDARELDPYGGVAYAFNSWCKDLAERGWEHMVDASPLEDWLDVAPDKVKPQESRSRALHGVRAYRSLDHAHRTTGAPVIRFLARIRDRKATPGEWTGLVERTEAVSPLPDPPWATFEEIVALIDETR